MPKELFNMLALIMPCKFEHLPFLPVSLLSVMNSSLKPNQLIFVADGFVPNWELRTFLLETGWQVISNNEILGPGASKNIGLNLLNSDIDYVAFLDADDVMHPDRLSRSVKRIENSGLDIVGCQAVFFTYDYEQNCLQKLNGHPYRNESFLKIKSRNERSKVGMVFASMVVKKEIFANLGGFPPHAMRGEDFLFIKKVLDHGFVIENLGEILYGYQHSLFDGYSLFKNDQKARGNDRNILYRYALNCLYRILNSRLAKNDKSNWNEIFDEIEEHLENSFSYQVLN